ncbi:MAG: YciI family protein [Telluria sp.]
MFKHVLATCAALALTLHAPARADAPATSAPSARYDAALAASLGADERGMRQYVLVILKTGPNKMAAGAARTKMFEGHFANMNKLAGEKKLILAGPLDGTDGRRGLFVLNTPDVEAAKTWVATDPVIINGEMVAEYQKFYGSAALMMVNDIHSKIEKK